MPPGDPPKGYVWDPTKRKYVRRDSSRDFNPTTRSHGDGKPVRPDDRADRRLPQPRSVDPDKNKRASGPSTSAMNWKARQKFLKNLGYDVRVDGVFGPQTATAWRNYQSAKKNDIDIGKAASYWNRKSGRASPSSGAMGHPDNSQAHHDAFGGSGKPVPGGKPKPKSQPGKPSAAVGRLLQGRSLPNYGDPLGGIPIDVGEEFDPRMAGRMAGLEFDPQIRDLGIERARQPVQAAQNRRDLSNWYSQVDKAVQTAGVRDAEINAAARGGLESSVKGILSSLGGGANEGSGMVGAAGAEALGTIGALGSAQEQYNADIRPLLTAEGAGLRAREMARQTQIGQDIANRIIAARGQRGQAEAKHGMDIRGANNELRAARTDRALSAAQFRAQFGANRDDAQAARSDAAFSRALALDSQQLAHDQFTEGARSNRAQELLELLGQSGSGTTAPKPPKGSWDDSTASVRGAASLAAWESVKDENGNLYPEFVQPDGKANVPLIVQAVNNTYRQRGWDPRDPRVARVAMTVLQDLGVVPDPRWYGLGARR